MIRGLHGKSGLILKVLVFLLVCTAFTVALGAKLANRKLFAETYVLRAEFTDATGVLVGDAVKVAGVDVGRVEATEIRDGKAVITFNVERHVEVPVDSTVANRWRNVLGQRFIYIYPGRASETLDEGALIPASQTRDVADIGEFLNRLGPILQAIDPRQANRFLDAMNTALAHNEQVVRHLLDSGASLATDLAAKDRQIAQLIDSADRIMAAYARQNRDIEQIFDDLEQVSDMLARRTDDINAVVTNFSDVQEQLDHLLKSSRTNIDESIDSLRAVASTVASNKRNFRRTLRSLPMGLANYFQTTSWGEWFNVRIVKFLVQDSAGRDVVVVSELDNQHGDEGGGTGGDGRRQRGQGDGSPGEAEPRPVRENVGSILRYVLLGDGR